MDGEVDFTQTLVERFTAYHRRALGRKDGKVRDGPMDPGNFQQL
jgi:hypothetical protein